MIAGMLGAGSGWEDRLKVVIGIALVASVLTTLFRQVMDRRAQPRQRGRPRR
ncbi:hypothetical protein HBB16_12680 [Pseudonocardia sp. MCCB 268]|nr:hypothetical protein [Pseudonocardia cytotoxica]